MMVEPGEAEDKEPVLAVLVVTLLCVPPRRASVFVRVVAGVLRHNPGE